MEGLRLPVQGMSTIPPYMYPSPIADPRQHTPANLSTKTPDAREMSPPAGSRHISPSAGGSSAAANSPTGIKRSLPTEYPGPSGQDVLDLSIKKPKLTSPVSTIPSDTVAGSRTSASDIPSAGPSSLPSTGGSVNGTCPTLGLTTPGVAGLTAHAAPYPSGYPTSYLDPRLLSLHGLTSIPDIAGAGGVSSLTPAQQQSLFMAPPVAGYPMSYLSPHMSYAHLYAAAAEREKLLQKTHMSPLNTDVVRMQSTALL